MKASKKKNNAHGILIPAGLFIGLGIGLLTGNVAALTILGMGIGFVAMWLSNRK